MNINRSFLKKTINLIAITLGATVMFQAVRFCQGLAPFPLRLFDAPVRTDAWMYIEVPIYYLLGITLWVFVGFLIIYAGIMITRITTVGFRPFVAECMATKQDIVKGDFMQSNTRVEQRIQDIVNFERPIQDFLGWVLSLDKKGFIAVLERAGHDSSNYHEEKWIEFERDKLAFLWGRTPEFYGFWSKGKWSN